MAKMTGRREDGKTGRQDGRGRWRGVDDRDILGRRGRRRLSYSSLSQLQVSSAS